MSQGSERNPDEPADWPDGRDRVLGILNDHWSSAVLRVAHGLATSRRTDYIERLAIPPQLLNERLDELMRAALMDVRGSSDSDEAVFVLTDKGRELEPIVAALDRWKRRWEDTAVPLLMFQNDSADTAPADGDGADGAGTRRDGDDPTPAETLPARISLLGTFGVQFEGGPVCSLPKSSQRLLAFVALENRVVGRATIAGQLWPNATEFRAALSLRTALTRLNEMRDAVVTSSSGLCLADSVSVDLRDAQGLAHRLIQPFAAPSEHDLGADATAALSAELLPDWYDDWAVDAGQDWRQTRMNALEAQARMLIDTDRLPEAARVARIVMRLEPLRESARSLLVRIHLAEGNQAEAIRAFDQYRQLLLEELGLEPTAMLSELVSDIRVP